MKVPPLILNADINRVGLSLPFSPDLLWRNPLAFPQTGNCTLPSSPLHDIKNQMPANLAPDPRMWTREDVSNFLRWFEKEFELLAIDISKFCMNGKALCMLTKTDLADRAPGSGDILHNTLQFLLRDSPQIPPSPLTPHHPLLSPSPLTGNPVQSWPLVSSEIHSLGHLLQQGGSVTLSPAPSEQSGGSPRYQESISNAFHQINGLSNSDSEESARDSSSPQRSPIPQNTFSAHALASLKHLTEYQRVVAAAAAAHSSAAEENLKSVIQPSVLPAPPTDELVEPGTNGRLLWDFLQQLLNDREQRYSRYIAWKNRDTGVFKIVDPPGLARLWGIQKNHLSMNYDKMSRALRYYYRVNILRKVQGERHCYQFLRNPSELKSIKNISLLRGAPLCKFEPAKIVPTVPSAAMEEDEGPTDLSMPTVHQYYQQSMSSSSQPQNLKVVDRTEDIDIKQEDLKEES